MTPWQLRALASQRCSSCPWTRLLVLLLLLGCMGSAPFSHHGSAAAQPADSSCQALAETYFEHHSRESLPYDTSNMAYFLHVPRTAGRTFHTCFLKLGVPVRRQCPNTYDHLRINVSVPNCYLLSSHDDFSVVSLLPNNVAVMSHIRDPVERFLSAYEFAVEVASRTFQRSGPPPRKDPRRINTEDVWPWSFLVPFFSKDMHERREKLLLQATQNPEGNWIKVTRNKTSFFFNKHKDISKWNLSESEAQFLLPPLDAYNNPLAMSLEEFADHPIARELLHNGQTYQVLGITNYSHWGDAPHMRECMWQNTVSRDHHRRLAIQRLNTFFHVGVTDRLADSVAAAGVAMRFKMSQRVAKPGAAKAKAGGQQGGQAQAASASAGAAQAAGDDPLANEIKVLRDGIQKSLQDMQALKEQLFDSNAQGHIGPEKAALEAKITEARSLLMSQQTMLSQLTAKQSPKNAGPAEGTLGVEFLKCARNAQLKNLERRVRSFSHVFMMDGRSIAFTKQARKAIPERVLQKIRDHNPMDMALHQEAERLLTQRRDQWALEHRLEELPDVKLPPIPHMETQTAYKIPEPKDDPLPIHQDTL